MKILKIVLVLVLFLFALALGAQNQQVVTFNYLVAEGDFHLSTLIGMIFVIGFAISGVIFGTMHFKSQLRVRKLNRKLKKLTPQVSVTPAADKGSNTVPAVKNANK
ncbi:LapA family protein [Vibrio rarus]|uniref:LapA family protein n=1 Tax=Vibrio rarus TaxID=413403 RepID=UPI0021C41C33|nr:lipopolysaccharide assembly protein LapA domain-containing protein [Vibrio rarus]